MNESCPRAKGVEARFPRGPLVVRRSSAVGILGHRRPRHSQRTGRPTGRASCNCRCSRVRARFPLGGPRRLADGIREAPDAIARQQPFAFGFQVAARHDHPLSFRLRGVRLATASPPRRRRGPVRRVSSSVRRGDLYSPLLIPRPPKCTCRTLRRCETVAATRNRSPFSTDAFSPLPTARSFQDDPHRFCLFSTNRLNCFEFGARARSYLYRTIYRRSYARVVQRMRWSYIGINNTPFDPLNPHLIFQVMGHSPKLVPTDGTPNSIHPITHPLDVKLISTYSFDYGLFG